MSDLSLSFLQTLCPLLGITFLQFWSINKFSADPLLSSLRYQGLRWTMASTALATISAGSSAHFQFSEHFQIGKDGQGIRSALNYFRTEAIRHGLDSGIAGGLSYPTTTGRHVVAIQWIRNSKTVRVREFREVDFHYSNASLTDDPERDWQTSAAALVNTRGLFVANKSMEPTKECYVWYCTNTSGLREHVQRLLREDRWHPQLIPARRG